MGRQLDLVDIAKVLGRPVSLWLRGTETLANAEQTLSYNRTFTVADTVTEWPAMPHAGPTRLRQGDIGELIYDICGSSSLSVVRRQSPTFIRPFGPS